jgi:maltooligosyltrehalose trehalohydrolase
MFQYYKTLIGLRKQQPALQNTDRDGMSVEHSLEKETISIYRVSDEQHVIAILNFSKSVQEVSLPVGHSVWHKLMSSSDAKWNGEEQLPEHINSGVLAVWPESFTLYTNIIYS